MMKTLRQLLKCCLAALLCISVVKLNAQDAIVGDGFGGRSWYRPANIVMGGYSGATVVSGQLYMWSGDKGGATSNVIFPVPYSATPSYPIKGGVTVDAQKPVDVTTMFSNRNGSGYVQPYAVPGFNNVKMIALGDEMGALIKADGTGWVWGDFQIGGGNGWAVFGSTAGYHTPVKVIDNAKYVSVGSSHIVFVKNDGTVWTLGDNGTGAFGNGTTSPTYTGSAGKGTTITTTPVQMTGITNAVRVAAYGFSAQKIGNTSYYQRAGTVILKADGTVWLTGAGVALIAKTANLSPTQIPGLSNIVDIKCAFSNAMALSATGDVYAWGSWSNGPPYGDATTFPGSGTFSYTPKMVKFPPGASKMVAIESSPLWGNTQGWTNFYAVDDGHKLWQWGTTAAYQPIIIATHVADVNASGLFGIYVTRTTDYPPGDRFWNRLEGNTQSGLMNVTPVFSNNTNNFNNPTNGYPLYEMYNSRGYWYQNFANGSSDNVLLRPGDLTAFGIGENNPSGATGSLICEKAQITPAPVQGTAANNLSLQVTVNVSQTGTFTPNISGSGMSLMDPNFVATTTVTGVQTFNIPIKYDGSPLNTVVFGFAEISGTCTITIKGSKPAIVNIITTDCVPTVGPALK